jgi:hypothetical protein
MDKLEKLTKKQLIEKIKDLSGTKAAMYSTPNEMKLKIDEYFRSEVGLIVVTDNKGNEVIGEDGQNVKRFVPPTVSGLALYLGFSDRHSLYDYRDRKPNFAHTVKSAITYIAKFAEEQLYGQNKAGAMFWLKNHRWSDKQEIEHSGTVEGFEISIKR